MATGSDIALWAGTAQSAASGDHNAIQRAAIAMKMEKAAKEAKRQDHFNIDNDNPA